MGIFNIDSEKYFSKDKSGATIGYCGTYAGWRRMDDDVSIRFLIKTLNIVHFLNFVSVVVIVGLILPSIQNSLLGMGIQTISGAIFAILSAGALGAAIGGVFDLLPFHFFRDHEKVNKTDVILVRGTHVRSGIRWATRAQLFEAAKTLAFVISIIATLYGAVVVTARSTLSNGARMIEPTEFGWPFLIVGLFGLAASIILRSRKLSTGR